MLVKTLGSIAIAAVFIPSVKAQEETGKTDEELETNESKDDGDSDIFAPTEVEQFYWSSSKAIALAVLRMECYGCNDFNKCVKRIDEFENPIRVTSDTLADALAELDDGCDADGARSRGHLISQEDLGSEEDAWSFMESLAMMEIKRVITGLELQLICDSSESALNARKESFHSRNDIFMVDDKMVYHQSHTDFTSLFRTIKRVDGCEVPSADACSKCEGKAEECRDKYEEMTRNAEKDENLVFVTPAWLEAGCPAFIEGDIDDLEEEYKENIPEYREYAEMSNEDSIGDDANSIQFGIVAVMIVIVIASLI